jgi:hypothetical protein
MCSHIARVFPERALVFDLRAVFLEPVEQKRVLISLQRCERLRAGDRAGESDEQEQHGHPGG